MPDLSSRLRHRIDFQVQDVDRDSEGVETLTWIDAVTEDGVIMTEVPAEVLTGPGREGIRSGQKQSDVAARITCRWFPGLRSSWRIVWDDQIYDIESWDLDRTGRREYRIVCRTGKNGGQ